MLSEQTARALQAHFPGSTDHAHCALPCPGCGSYSISVGQDPWGTRWLALCPNCEDGAEDARRVYGSGATEVEAIAEWNDLVAEQGEASNLSTGAGGANTPPSVAHARPVASHDTIGDLAALTLSGNLADVRITTSAHRDAARRNWLVSGQTRRRTVRVSAPGLEQAMARLVEMAEADAVHERLVTDEEPVLSAERDTRPSEAP